MHIQLHIDTAEPLNERDKAILAALVADQWPPEKPAEASPTPRKQASKAKATPPPTATPSSPESAPSAVSARTPASDSPDEAEEPPAPAKKTKGPTLQEALDRGVELMAQKRGAEVKAALEKAGAARVSQLSGGQIAVFLEALDG